MSGAGIENRDHRAERLDDSAMDKMKAAIIRMARADEYERDAPVR